MSRGGLLPTFGSGSGSGGGYTSEEFEALEARVETNEAEVATLEATSLIRRYLSTTKPSGFTTDFTALYQFDDTADYFTDRTGNGHDLTLANGTYLKTYNKTHGLVSWRCGVNTWANSPVNANLACLGAHTVELVTAFRSPTADEDMYFAVGASGEDEADNYTVWVGNDLDTAAIHAFHENGAGNNNYARFLWNYPRGILVYGVMVRAANGKDYSLYIDGRFCETVSVSNAPTGGSLGRIWVGGNSTGSDYYGDIYSIRYSKAAMTAAQIAEVSESLRSLS